MGLPSTSNAKSSGCESSLIFCDSASASSARFESCFLHCNHALKSPRIALAFFSASDSLNLAGEAGFFAGHVSFKDARLPPLPAASARLLCDGEEDEEEEEMEEERRPADERFAREGVPPWQLLLFALSRFPRGVAGFLFVVRLLLAPAFVLHINFTFSRGEDHLLFCTAGAFAVDAGFRADRGEPINFSPNARLIGATFWSTCVEEDHDFTLVLLTLPAHVPGRGNVRCFRADLGEGAGTPDEVAGRLGDAAAASSGEVCLIGL